MKRSPQAPHKDPTMKWIVIIFAVVEALIIIPTVVYVIFRK